MVGSGLIIASACVCNNYLDRELDAKMERTKKRALVTGKISVKSAFFFAALVGVLGVVILLRFTNVLTLIVGLIGFVDYVFLYGYAKRRSIHGTLIGGISGAMPIVAGYTAVTNTFDITAFLLFLIMMFWQMPHFYAIALYRRDDYATAGIPIISVIKGIEQTKVHMLLYLLGFIITALLLPLFAIVGMTYALVMMIVSAYWLWISVNGVETIDMNRWARKMFKTSLICLLVFSALLFGTAFLP